MDHGRRARRQAGQRLAERRRAQLAVRVRRDREPHRAAVPAVDDGAEVGLEPVEGELRHVRDQELPRRAGREVVREPEVLAGLPARGGALAGDVGGPAAVDLAGVGAEAPPRAPAAGAHPALAHGPPHAPLGRGRGRLAVGPRAYARRHLAVAAHAPEGRERAGDPRRERPVVTARGGESAPLVLVGALRYPQEGRHAAEAEPVVPPQPLSQLGLLPVRESRRVSCFWVAEHLPEHRALHPQPVQLRLARAGRPLLFPHRDRLRGHLSAPAGLRGPSRHDRPGREPEGPRDLAGRLAEAEQPQRLGPGLLGVAGVLGAPAGPGDPRRLDRQAPAEGLLLPGRERPAGRRAPQPARGGRGQPLRPHPLHAEHLILVCIQCSLRSDRSNRSNFLPQFPSLPFMKKSDYFTGRISPFMIHNPRFCAKVYEYELPSDC